MNKKKVHKFLHNLFKTFSKIVKSLKIFYNFCKIFLIVAKILFSPISFIFKSIEIKYYLFIYLLFVVPTKTNIYFTKQILKFPQNKSQCKTIIYLFNLKQFNCYDFSKFF